MRIDCTNIAIGTGLILAGAVFLVAHPIIGIIAQPFLAIEAFYHKYQANLHLQKTMDEKGHYLKDLIGPNNYMSKETKFTANDLTRLENEKQRLCQNEDLLQTLRTMRGLAKCIIPVIGLIWAICTELQVNGSLQLGCRGCMQHEGHWTPKQALKWHIKTLKDQIQKDAMAGLVKKFNDDLHHRIKTQNIYC